MSVNFIHIAEPNYPFKITDCSVKGTLDFDLSEKGHISQDDIILKISYLEDSPNLTHLNIDGKQLKIEHNNSLGAF